MNATLSRPCPKSVNGHFKYLDFTRHLDDVTAPPTWFSVVREPAARKKSAFLYR